MSHVAHINESCHTYECVISLIYMSQFTHVNASCHTYRWVMSHMWMSHVTHIHVCDNDSCICVTWCIHVCELTHVYVWYDANMNESFHTRECVKSHMRLAIIPVCAHLLILALPSCHICDCVMSHMWMGHVIHVNETCHTRGHTRGWDMSHMWMSYVTQMICNHMGWLR